MKLVLAGATGFIGSLLTEKLLARGDKVILFSRKPQTGSSRRNIRYVSWNPTMDSDFQKTAPEMAQADAVINLAGEGIADKRWSKQQKSKILESRVRTTQMIARSIENANERPKVLINASAIGYYGPRGNEWVSETEQAGNDFLSNTCKAWEEQALRVEDFGVRVVRLRIGIVLGTGG